MQSEKIMEKKRLCKVKRLHSTPSIISSPPPFLLHKMQKRDNLNNLTKTSQLLAWKCSFNQPSLGTKKTKKKNTNSGENTDRHPEPYEDHLYV